jgi:hypothetical protein
VRTGRQLLRFQHFDPPLDRNALAEHLDLKLSKSQVPEIASMDNGPPGNVARLLAIGRAMAERFPEGAF